MKFHQVNWGDLAGWDWTAIQLDDGREVKAYRLRTNDGASDLGQHFTGLIKTVLIGQYMPISLNGGPSLIGPARKRVSAIPIVF